MSAHTVTVGAVPLETGARLARGAKPVYVARCPCGWRSAKPTTKALAEGEAIHHVKHPGGEVRR